MASWWAGEKAVETADNAADSRGESLNAAETSRRTVQCALAFIYWAAFHGTFKRHAWKEKWNGEMKGVCVVCVSDVSFLLNFPRARASYEGCARACSFYHPCSCMRDTFHSIPRMANTEGAFFKNVTLSFWYKYTLRVANIFSSFRMFKFGVGEGELSDFEIA